MANIAKWIGGASSFSTGTLADNTNMASTASGAFKIAQVSAADTIIDNATNKDLFLAIQVNLGSWTPAVTDYLTLYLLYSLDGTNYESGSSSFLPTRSWQTIPLSTNTTAAAKRFSVCNAILPFKFKVLWAWNAANAVAASSNDMGFATLNANLNG